MTSIRASHAATAETITYLQIVEPFIAGCGRGGAPGFLAITSTVLQNGASLILTFIEKVSHRVAETSFADPGVHALHDLADVDLHVTWSGVYTAYSNAILPDDRSTRLEHAADLRKPFAVLGHYIIVRDEDAKNPCADPVV